MNRLVGHVMDKTRPPARLVGSSMAQNLVESIRQPGPHSRAGHRPDQLITPERMSFVEQAVSSWSFPAHELDMDELTCAAMIMIEHQLRPDEMEPYRIERSELIAFLLATRRQYKHEREVTYHNWRHAIDVTQSVYQFLKFIGLCPPGGLEQSNGKKQRTSVERLLQPLDGLILLVSAIGHDVGHPGVNNAFLVACSHPLAQLYNDKSVLENYHCSAYSQLLRRHWPALTRHPPFRTTLISNILATDMQRHFEYMGHLTELREKLSDSHMDADSWSAKDQDRARELIMALLMKAADISNIARPFDISAAWAQILLGEFARQGELENELDIPTCLFGGPPVRDDLLAAAQSQKGFMNLFGFPLFQGLSDIMPSISYSVETLGRNQKSWDERIADETRKREEPEKSHATFASLGKDHEVEVQRKHRTSEPAVVPVDAAQPPSTPIRWKLDQGQSGSPTRHPAADDRLIYTTGLPHKDEGKRASAPIIGPGGLHLSALPSSRRSSKDVALDQLHQLSLFAHQHLPGSRKSSEDANYQLNQSYPSSRRGSKDESLTTILVTSQGSPSRGSPGSRSVTQQQGNASPQRSAEPKKTAARKQSAARSSVSHSHAASSTTATTALSQQSPSTQPSSLAPHDSEIDDSSAAENATSAVPLADSPTLADRQLLPSSVSVTTQSTVSGRGPELASQVPSTLPSSIKSGESPRIVTRTTEDSEESNAGRSTPRKDEQQNASIRESRSRSRLRSLRFWKKKRDTTGTETSHESVSESP